MKKNLLFLLLFLPFVLMAKANNNDSTSLRAAFSNGHLRYFFMNTDNENGLSNY